MGVQFGLAYDEVVVDDIAICMVWILWGFVVFHENLISKLQSRHGHLISLVMWLCGKLSLKNLSYLYIPLRSNNKIDLLKPTQGCNFPRMQMNLISRML